MMKVTTQANMKTSITILWSATPPIGFKKVNELNSNYKSMLMSTQCIKI